MTKLISHDHTLAEGDVALVFKKNGGLAIIHKVTEVRETGVIDGQKNAGGFLLALACRVAMEDEVLMGRLIVEAARRLDELEFAAAPATVQ